MRNPFRMRASQRTVNDEQFVRLFGAGALGLASDIKDPWGGLVFLRSAPGGGKSTLLRLLTPRPLRLLSRLSDEDSIKSTYNALRDLGAIGQDGPEVLGTMVPFTPEYRDLAEIDRGNSMFRALLNARIVISTLRALLERSEKIYPDDLDTISAVWEPESGATIPPKASGTELFSWASEIEREFYDQIDNLGMDDADLKSHARLDGLTWFARAELFDVGGKVETKRVLLLDDLQWLSSTQRTGLVDILTNARESCGVWVAERLEALNARDLLSEGALKDRDYNSVLQLERRWAQDGKTKAFAKFVEQIADRRVAKADGFDSPVFYNLIADDDYMPDWQERCDQKCVEVETRILGSLNRQERYEEWLEGTRQATGNAMQKAIRWKSLEILIERDRRKNQASFDFDQLPEEELPDKLKAVERGAEHLVRNEIGAPVYFGRSALAVVSSWNVEQYLEVAGDMFEEISATAVGRRDPPPPMSPARQDAIIRSVAASRWDGLVRRLPQGYEARRFLEAVCGFSQQQTYRPTAPYQPGVTGFAISMSARKLLIDGAEDEFAQFTKLRSILTSLVSHNLLIPREDHRNKDKSYVLFYLNRLLCVQYDLPLGYGGWREKSLKELVDWMELGHVSADVEAKLV